MGCYCVVHSGEFLIQNSQTFGSEQLSSYHVERLLTGEPADSLAIAKEITFHNFCSSLGRNGMKDQANGLLRGAARRSSNPRNANAKSCAALFANTFGEGGRYF